MMRGSAAAPTEQDTPTTAATVMIPFIVSPFDPACMDAPCSKTPKSSRRITAVRSPAPAVANTAAKTADSSPHPATFVEPEPR